MILKSLSLKNFRRFESLEIDFHERLTVIVARNGQGKSTILDATTVALGTFVGAFDLGKAEGIHVSDARYARKGEHSENEQQFPVTVSAGFSDPDIQIERELTGPKNRTTIKGAAELTNYGKSLMTQVRNLKDVTLPVIAYYGSGRLWVTHKNMERKSVLSESRSMGYEDCLSSASNYTQIQQWMAKATYAVLQQQSMPHHEGSSLPGQVEYIKSTVNKVLASEGWSNFHYNLSHEQLAMVHGDHGTLPVSLLSDGVRAMVSLTADLAWRCAKLNPHLGRDTSAKTPGIVFIDEVDMHLHPAWQQKVITSLQDAFPEVQLVVTTHSPQVLTTVSKECIRLIQGNDVYLPAVNSMGEESRTVLEDIMHVPSRPKTRMSEKLTEYLERVNRGDIESSDVLALRSELEKHYGVSSQLRLADMMINRWKAVQKAKQKKNLE